MKAKKSKRQPKLTATTVERPKVWTRDEVVRDYQHPAPEWHKWLVLPDPDALAALPARARALVRAALREGYAVMVQQYRGTTYPTWRVNLPESGGPPVDPSQYHGDLITGIAIGIAHGERGTATATYHDGRLFHASINGVTTGINDLTAQVAGGGILKAPTPRRKAD